MTIGLVSCEKSSELLYDFSETSESSIEHKLTDWTETYFRIPSKAEIELPQ